MESINDCSRSFPANVTDQAISNKCPVCDNNGLAVSKVTVNH